MLFRTYEPYEEDNKEEKDKEDVCFICYEFVNNSNYNDDNDALIKLNLNPYYFKLCLCDGFIHKSCLKKWHEFNNSCPICRNKLLKNGEYTVAILNYYDGFIIVNNFCIYFLKLEKTKHLLRNLRALSYILVQVYCCIKIYILMTFIYFLSFFLVILLQSTLS